MSAKKKSTPVVRITTIEGKRHSSSASASASQANSKVRSSLISKGSKVGKTRFG